MACDIIFLAGRAMHLEALSHSSVAKVDASHFLLLIGELAHCRNQEQDECEGDGA